MGSGRLGPEQHSPLRAGCVSRVRGPSRRTAGLDTVDVAARSAPSELRGDVFQDAFDYVRVVVDSERVRKRHKQCIGRGNRFVGGEFIDKDIWFPDVRTAEDGARVGIDEADVIAI